MLFPAELQMMRELLYRWRYGEQSQQLYDETSAALTWLDRYDKQTCDPLEGVTHE